MKKTLHIPNLQDALRATAHGQRFQCHMCVVGAEIKGATIPAEDVLAVHDAITHQYPDAKITFNADQKFLSANAYVTMTAVEWDDLQSNEGWEAVP